MELLKSVGIAVAFIAVGVWMQLYGSKINWRGDKFRALTPQQAKTIIASYENQCSEAQAEGGALPVHPENSPLVVSEVTRSMASVVPTINGNGNLFLYSGSGVGAVKEVAQFKGNMWLCGFNLTELSNFKGTITVTGGQLESVTQSEGNIFIIGGGTYPKDVKGFKGAIVVKVGEGKYEGRSYNF